MDRGNLNIINQWGNHKKRGANFKVSVGESKADTMCGSNLVGGGGEGIFKGNMVFQRLSQPTRSTKW